MSTTGDDVDGDSAHGDDGKRCLLLNIPQELRDMIYKEALVDPNGEIRLKAECVVRNIHDRVVRVETVPNAVDKRSTTSFSPTLLATCKQVYDEAIRYVYHQPFVFYTAEAVHIFLLNMSPTTTRLLKDITILNVRIKTVNNNALLSGLRHATGLRRFRLAGRVTVSDVHLRLSDKRIGTEIASRFYGDAAYFIRHFVAEHGLDALLRVVEFNMEDMQGGGNPDAVADWTQFRTDAVMAGVKDRLRKNLRLHAEGRIQPS